MPASANALAFGTTRRLRFARVGGVSLNAQGWFEHGYDRLRVGDIEGARLAFEHALSGAHGPLKPAAKAGVLRALGRLAEDRGDSEAAIACYQAALVEDPGVGVSKRLGALIRARARR